MAKKANFEAFEFSKHTIGGRRINHANVQRSVVERKRRNVETVDSQLLSVFVTAPSVTNTEPSNDIVVRATAFSDDNGRPEGALFDAYLAEATERTVYAVNAPGVDYFQTDETVRKGQQMTPEQHEQLTETGSFKKVGEASMIALRNAALAEGHDDPSFILTASSMGVALTAGMVRTAYDKDIKLAGVSLAEPVNHISRPLPRLGWQFMAANATAADYLKCNPDDLSDAGESMGFWLKRVAEGKRANWAYARALGAGTFMADLGGIEGLADTKTPVFLSHGSASALSGNDRQFGTLLDEMAPLDLKHMIYPGHDHPYTMTVQSVVDGVKNIVNRQQ